MPFYTPRKIESKFYTPIYTQLQPSQLIKIEPQPILEEIPIEPLPESEEELVSTIESQPEPLLEEIPIPEGIPFEPLPESEIEVVESEPEPESSEGI